jgi:hypothetical protein
MTQVGLRDAHASHVKLCIDQIRDIVKHSKGKDSADPELVEIFGKWLRKEANYAKSLQMYDVVFVKSHKDLGAKYQALNHWAKENGPHALTLQAHHAEKGKGKGNRSRKMAKARARMGKETATLLRLQHTCLRPLNRALSAPKSFLS